MITKWTTEGDGTGDVFDASTPVNANAVYYAKWDNYTVSFDACGGSDTESKEIANGAPIGTVPEATKAGCTLEGWYPNENYSGDKLTAETVINGDVTYYAKWQCTVTFNAGVGSLISSSKTVNEGSTIGTLPTPTAPSPNTNGYIFKGWYTGADGSGNKLADNTTINANVTYYAKWLQTKGVAAASGRSDVEWVQLWEDGPKWATFNLGATITSYSYATEYTSSNVGGEYIFACNTDYRGAGKYKVEGLTVQTTDDIQSTAYDTAKNLWGNNWKMPNKDDLEKLFNADGIKDRSNEYDTTYANGGSGYTIWTWYSGQVGSQYVSGCTIPGWKVSGAHAGYTNNSIFIPAAGFADNHDNSNGHTCFLRASTYAYRAGMTGSEGFSQNWGWEVPFSIRPILAN